MRKLAGIAFAAALLGAGAAQAKEATTTLKVSGWHCSGCSNKTAATVKRIDGVKEARGDKATDTLVVTFDDEKTSVAAIEKAVTDLNYQIVK